MDRALTPMDAKEAAVTMEPSIRYSHDCVEQQSHDSCYALSRTTVTASLFVAHPRIYHLSYTLPR